MRFRSRIWRSRFGLLLVPALFCFLLALFMTLIGR